MKQLMIFFLITTIFSNEVQMPLSKSDSDRAFHFTEETVQNGWSADGQMFYVDGKYVTGPIEIDGFNYYFDEKTGKMVHGWKTVKENGVEKKYWYGQETGHMLYGDQRINGTWYHFDEETGELVEEKESGEIGWSAEGDKYYIGNSYVTGEYEIDGKYYYFDLKTGVVFKNCWREVDSSKVYYGDDGVRVSGEKTIEGKNYYFLPDTGLMKKGWRKKDGTYVYYNSEGCMVFGEQVIKGYKYYFDDATGLMIKGWRETAEAKYYYNEKGCMLFGEQIIDGKTYHFDDTTGTLIEDKPVECHWSKDKTMYYVGDKYVTGEYEIDGKYYYFNPDTGVMYKYKWKKTEDGNYVFYGNDGLRVTGEQTIRGYKYYFNPETGLMHRGWREVENKKYYYNNKGCMLFGDQIIDGVGYSFDNDTGVLIGKTKGGKTGWSADGTMYYVGGKYVTGEKSIEGKYYYFDLKTGKMYKYKWRKTNSSYVFYGKNGVRVTGEQTIRGHNYYFNTSNGLMKKGWRKKNGTFVYYNSKGCMLFGEQTIKGNKYYFNETTGLMKKGWRNKDDTKVYYNSKGCMLFGEQTIDGKDYYFRLGTGLMYKGWRTVSGKKNYYDDNGVKSKGQKKINGSWYYFDTNGVMAIGRTSIPASANSGTAKVIVADANGKYILHNTKVGLKYYRISSATDAVNVGRVEHETKIYMEGIDVSEWNGNFDFSSYKNQFVIIRASWGQTHKDKKVEQFVNECERLGIPYGFYTYSYAENTAEAKEEAQFCISIINDLEKKHGGKLKNFCMGVWFDMEDADHWKARRGFSFTNANIGGLCYTFCNEISKKGYYTGIYMSASWLKYLTGTKANQYDKWVAHWGSSNNGDMTTDMSSYGTMQQYTSTNGKLDKDVIFVDKSHYKNK